MRKTLILLFIILSSDLLFGQFDVHKLQIRLGYSLYNARAKRINHLITTFNNGRYPVEITENMGSVNWLSGISVGGVYEFMDGIFINADIRGMKQQVGTTYVGSGKSRQYLFRQYTLDAGVILPIGEEKWFRHYGGGGISAGGLGAFTYFGTSKDNVKSREMVNIDRTFVLGLHLNYEARFSLHKNLQLYLRPYARYALNSHVRRITDFFDPQVYDDKTVYGTGEPEKYDNINLNGLGIEGGLLILIPQF